MVKVLSLSLCLLIGSLASAQIVAKMEVKEPIPGVCNDKEVYVLFPTKGQEKAVCPVAEDSVERRLNKEVSFLKKNKNYKDKGTINIIINCRGEVVKCEMDNKTKSSELDKQIVAVFNSLGSWEAGKLEGKPVDSSRLWAFEIKNGVITVD